MSAPYTHQVLVRGKWNSNHISEAHAQKAADRINGMGKQPLAKVAPINKDPSVSKTWKDVADRCDAAGGAYRSNAAPYRGKHPDKIKSVSAGPGGPAHVRTNWGEEREVSAKQTGGVMPKPGEHLSKYDAARRTGSGGGTTSKADPDWPARERNENMQRFIEEGKRDAEAGRPAHSNVGFGKDLRAAYAKAYKEVKKGGAKADATPDCTPERKTLTLADGGPGSGPQKHEATAAVTGRTVVRPTKLTDVSGDKAKYVKDGKSHDVVKRRGVWQLTGDYTYTDTINALAAKCDAYERKYPSHTTAELKAAVAAGRGTPAMLEEIAKRESGESKVRVTPQIKPLGAKSDASPSESEAGRVAQARERYKDEQRKRWSEMVDDPEEEAGYFKNGQRMDAKSDAGERKYPSYTTAQLKEAVDAGRGTPAMEAEIAARESGASQVRVTPQIAPVAGSKPTNKIGRM